MGMRTKKGRFYEKKLEVLAPAEAVWKAITEGEELTRWFCSKATCQSGLGGEQHIAWGGGVKVMQVITVWEPNSHLRTEVVRPKPGKAASSEPAEPYAIDWHLETEGGGTRVRMVASGFGDGPEWDYEYEGTYAGWDVYHWILMHYLEYHRGKVANNVILYAMLELLPAEAWNSLAGSQGLAREGSLADLSIGGPFRFVTAAGDEFAGVVRKYEAGKSFAGLVESLNKSILVMELATAPGRGDFLYLALSTWGLPMADVDALGARLKSLIHGLFPQKTNEPITACADAGGTNNE
jgi:uncharacterized protein YndB with AHSA1/START domain